MLQTIRLLATIPLASILVALCLSPLQAAPPVYAGKWKVTFIDTTRPGKVNTPWLLEIGDKDDQGNVAMTIAQSTAPEASKPEVKDKKGTEKDKSLSWKVTVGKFEFPASLAVSDKKAEEMLGSIRVGKQRVLLRLRPCSPEEFAKSKGVKDPEGVDYWQKATGEKGKKRDGLLAFVRENFSTESVGLDAARLLLEGAIEQKQDNKAKEHAASYISAFAPFGDEAKLDASENVLRLLQEAGDEKVRQLAIAQAAEARKLVKDTYPRDVQVRALSLIASVEKTNGKEDPELKKKIDALEGELDKDYLKGLGDRLKAASLETKDAPARDAKQDRTVLLEAFVNSQTVPSAAWELTLSEVAKSFEKAGTAIVLRYHLHLPTDDPLANADSEKRGDGYGVSTVPGLFVDGKYDKIGTGDEERVPEFYKSQQQNTLKRLGDKAGAKLDLKVEPMDKAHTLKATVTFDKDQEKAPESLRVRFVLVEDEVRYAGKNNVRLHHQVVRAMPGGVDGVKLTADPTDKKKFTAEAPLNVEEVRKALNKHLDERKDKPFTEDRDRPLELNKLKVVAILQDVELQKKNREKDGFSVLQATIQPIPPAAE